MTMIDPRTTNPGCPPWCPDAHLPKKARHDYDDHGLTVLDLVVFGLEVSLQGQRYGQPSVVVTGLSSTEPLADMTSSEARSLAAALLRAADIAES